MWRCEIIVPTEEMQFYAAFLKSTIDSTIKLIPKHAIVLILGPS